MTMVGGSNGVNLPPEIQEKLEGMQKIQIEVRQLVARHQQFESQLNENQMVKEELDLINEGDNVYKMHGKVLIRQDVTEAKTNVNSRIKLIQAEITKIDANIKAANDKRDGLQRSIMEFQQKRVA